MELFPLATALFLGFVHAFEADHLAAVSTFAVRRPRLGAAARFGLEWATGHGLAVIIAGTALVALRLQLHEAMGHYAERLVGVTLVALGVWTLRGAARLHAHVHRHSDGTVHDHVHGHHFGAGHEHGHAATAVGVLHGLAGAAPAVAVIPLTAGGAPWTATLGLVLFAVGTAAAMLVYALIAGWLARRAIGRSVRLARGIAVLTGVLTIGIGCFWMFG